MVPQAQHKVDVRLGLHSMEHIHKIALTQVHPMRTVHLERTLEFQMALQILLAWTHHVY